MCDASDIAVGAMLEQRKDKVFNSTYYASKKLDASQSMHNDREREVSLGVQI